MLLPCGKCLGCREAKAKEWALRCRLEFNLYDQTAFTTLTYDEKNLPVTLQKRHLQLFLKRLRKRLAPDRHVRFFASGEYGETTKRPHYHSILFGLGENEKTVIQEAWPHGHAHTVKATHGAIAYVAGYTAKKYGEEREAQEERVDETTGEVYNYQPPFLQMSRKPGIGGEARKHKESWRKCAILNGKTQSVPRYLHEAWKQTATTEQKEQLDNEKREIMKQIVMTEQQRKAAEQIAIKNQEMKAGRRTKI